MNKITNDKTLVIYGYISISLKVLSVPEGISNRTRKELDGFSAKIHGEKIKEIPCYLIGQLSRTSIISNDILSGRDIIEFAFRIIEMSVLFVGGRYIMIECKNNPNLIHFYRENGFREISKIPDGEELMVQMIRKI